MALAALKRIDVLFDIERESYGKAAEYHLPARQGTERAGAPQSQGPDAGRKREAVAPCSRGQGPGRNAQALGPLTLRRDIGSQVRWQVCET